jgi:hypothetical protein
LKLWGFCELIPQAASPTDRKNPLRGASKLYVINASNEHDFDQVLASLIQLRAGGLVIAAHAFSPAVANSSARLPPGTPFRRCTKTASSSPPAAW